MMPMEDERRGAPPARQVAGTGGAPTPTGATPTVFLDRDGVINRRRATLVRKPAHLDILEGVPTAIAELGAAGHRVVVVTNQSPVGYGLIRPDDLEAIHARIAEAVRDAGGAIAAFYHCPHRRTEACACAKPRPGMLERAAAAHAVDRARSWMVGDKASDVAAGRAFGVRTIWITGSRFAWERFKARPDADAAVRDLPTAVEHILAPGPPRSGPRPSR